MEYVMHGSYITKKHHDDGNDETSSSSDGGGGVVVIVGRAALARRLQKVYRLTIITNKYWNTAVPTATTKHQWRIK